MELCIPLGGHGFRTLFLSRIRSHLDSFLYSQDLSILVKNRYSFLTQATCQCAVGLREVRVGLGRFPEPFHLLPTFCPWCPLSILVAGKIVEEAFLGQTCRWHPPFFPRSGSQGDIRVQVRLRAQKGKELGLRTRQSPSHILLPPIFCLRCISKF